MTVDVPTLLARLGADSSDTDEATTALSIGQALVDAYIDSDGADVEIPQPIQDEAVLRAAVDAFSRAQAPNGILMSAVDDVGDGSSPILRSPADPLWSARLILAPYLAPVGFA